MDTSQQTVDRNPSGWGYRNDPRRIRCQKYLSVRPPRRPDSKVSVGTGIPGQPVTKSPLKNTTGRGTPLRVRPGVSRGHVGNFTSPPLVQGCQNDLRHVRCTPGRSRREPRRFVLPRSHVLYLGYYVSSRPVVTEKTLVRWDIRDRKTLRLSSLSGLLEVLQKSSKKVTEPVI